MFWFFNKSHLVVWYTCCSLCTSLILILKLHARILCQSLLFYLNQLVIIGVSVLFLELADWWWNKIQALFCWIYDGWLWAYKLATKFCEAELGRIPLICSFFAPLIVDVTKLGSKLNVRIAFMVFNLNNHVAQSSIVFWFQAGLVEALSSKHFFTLVHCTNGVYIHFCVCSFCYG